MVGTLDGRVAIVTGASRGLGKGVALGLGEAGAIVYITGRSVAGGPTFGPGTITETVDELTRLGGQGIAVPCDHRDDSQVEALFRRVMEEQGRLDILANNVYPAPALPGDIPRSHSGRTPVDTPFWKLPISYWDELFTVSARSHYMASVFAAPILVAQRSGVIINVSSMGGVQYSMNVPQGVEKAAVHKLTADMAHELRPHNVAVVALAPGTTNTELSMAHSKDSAEVRARARSPLFAGRAAAALAADPRIMEKSGKVLRTTDLADEYHFSDVAST